MAEAAVSMAVEKLSSLAIQRVVELQNVGGQVSQLKDELKYMQCFLKDAMEKQVRDERVRQWISDVREVAFDAEDVIDSFTLKVDERRKSRGLFERYACFPDHVYNLDKLRPRIDSIQRKLQDITKRCETYKIQNLGEASIVSSNVIEQRRRVCPWHNDTLVVGFEEHAKKLIEEALLMKKDGRYVASIVGMGGLGKSTLAKSVYNHPTIGEEFEKRAWLTVSLSFSLKALLIKLVQQLKPGESEQLTNTEKLKNAIEQLQQQLSQLQRPLNPGVGQHQINLKNLQEAMRLLQLQLNPGNVGKRAQQTNLKNLLEAMKPLQNQLKLGNAPKREQQTNLEKLLKAMKLLQLELKPGNVEREQQTDMEKLLEETIDKLHQQLNRINREVEQQKHIENLLNVTIDKLQQQLNRGEGEGEQQTILRNLLEAMRQLQDQLNPGEGEVEQQTNMENSLEESIKQLQQQLNPAGIEERRANMEKLEEEFMEKTVQECLKGTRYFIVLDDVWKEEHWELIARLFPDESDKPSRLLITSRTRNIVSVHTGYVLELERLNHDQSWQLFQEIAFNKNNTGNQRRKKLEDIGEKIVKKCHGLPLTITVMGGLLFKQGESVVAWERVWKKMQFHLEGDSVAPILDLSYQDLPPHLKSCFLCLSIFEEDALIDARTLIQLWIAEGIIVPQEKSKETMEEIAKSYLDDLINRNMVMAIKVSKDGQVKFCRIHDLLRDLSIMKAKEEIHFDSLSNENTSDQSFEKVRHLVIFYFNKKFVFPKSPMPQLRSLFLHVSFDSTPPSLWESLGDYLRILELGGLSFDYVPNRIGKLIGLKYLGMRNNNIREIPRSLGNLIHLQTLDISGNMNMHVPNVLWKLVNLRHLYMPINIICKDPLKLDTLKNLQTLCDVLTKNIVVDHLAEMANLHELNLELTMDVDVNKLLSSLSKLENLVSLHMSWALGHVLSLGWIANLQRLTKFHIFGELTALSECVPQALSYLELCYANLKEDPMPTLGKLPKLLHLKLVGNSYFGKEMVIPQDAFPSLEELCLHYMPKLEKIDIHNGGLPQLKQLSILHCPEDLEILPEVEGERMKRILQQSNRRGISKATESKLTGMVEAAVSMVLQTLDNLAMQQESSKLKLKQLKAALLAVHRLFEESLAGSYSNHFNLLDLITVAVSDIEDVIEFINLKVGALWMQKRLEMLQQKIEVIRRVMSWTTLRFELYYDHFKSEKYLTSIEPDPSHAEGLEEHVQTLLEKAILVENKGLSIASIVGMGGVGKTELAKKLYYHQTIRTQFKRCVWVSLPPHDTSPKQWLRWLVQDLKGEVRENLSTESLQQIVHEHLQGTQYFIVLDGVQRLEDWERISRALPDETDKASRVLITSRMHNIPRNVEYVHKLKGLDDDQSWQLFLKALIFEKSNGKCPQQLEDIARREVEKCNGLPLAIISTAKLIGIHLTFGSRWKAHYSHLGIQIPTLRASLELSYYDLDPNLRLRLQYLSFFKPKDAPMDARTLISIWIAEGIASQGKGEETMEEIESGYLDELINQSIVEGIKLSKDGQVKYCQIYNFLQDLCNEKAVDETWNFVNYSSNTSIESLSEVCHLAICCNDKFLFNRGLRMAMPHLYSLVLWRSTDGDNCISASFWKKLGYCLKLLELGGLGLTTVPKRVAMLIGLKYLGLRNNRLLKLPKSLGHLTCLQMLDISENKHVKVPNVIWKLDNLRHLYMPTDIICKKRLKLNTLKYLQTLANVSTKNIVVKHLAEMVSLRKLKLELTRHVDVNELLTSLAKLKRLSSIGLSWSLEFALSLDQIVNLEHLTLLHISGKLEKLPNFPQKLSYLKLRDTNLKEDPMQALGMLPNLLYLKLVGDSYVGEKMKIVHDGFPRLKVLDLYNQKKVIEICIENGALRGLEQFLRCEDLKILPEEQEKRMTSINKTTVPNHKGHIFHAPADYVSKFSPEAASSTLASSFGDEVPSNDSNARDDSDDDASFSQSSDTEENVGSSATSTSSRPQKFRSKMPVTTLSQVTTQLATVRASRGDCSSSQTSFTSAISTSTPPIVTIVSSQRAAVYTVHGTPFTSILTSPLVTTTSSAIYGGCATTSLTATSSGGTSVLLVVCSRGLDVRTPATCIPSSFFLLPFFLSSFLLFNHTFWIVVWRIPYMVNRVEFSSSPPAIGLLSHEDFLNTSEMTEVTGITTLGTLTIPSSPLPGTVFAPPTALTHSLSRLSTPPFDQATFLLHTTPLSASTSDALIMLTRHLDAMVVSSPPPHVSGEGTLLVDSSIRPLPVTDHSEVSTESSIKPMSVTIPSEILVESCIRPMPVTDSSEVLVSSSIKPMLVTDPSEVARTTQDFLKTFTAVTPTDSLILTIPVASSGFDGSLSSSPSSSIAEIRPVSASGMSMASSSFMNPFLPHLHDMPTVPSLSELIDELERVLSHPEDASGSDLELISRRLSILLSFDVVRSQSDLWPIIETLMIDAYDVYHTQSYADWHGLFHSSFTQIEEMENNRIQPLRSSHIQLEAEKGLLLSLQREKIGRCDHLRQEISHLTERLSRLQVELVHEETELSHIETSLSDVASRGQQISTEISFVEGIFHRGLPNKAWLSSRSSAFQLALERKQKKCLDIQKNWSHLRSRLQPMVSLAGPSLIVMPLMELSTTRESSLTINK